MKITFLGGTETVTGSKYLVETANTKVLVDCGLYQGYKWLRERNWQTLPLDIDQLDAVILTHAHLDHSGYIPVLYKRGFRGPVFTHYATRDLCEILLPDSGHIQEEDARYYSRHKLSKHQHPLPLYDRETAERSMDLFSPLAFEEVCEIGDIQFHLQSAGHILGAASIILEAEGKRVGFSGDVGRPDDIFMRPPQDLPELDLLLLESTYGNRRHDKRDAFQQLADVVTATAKNGGVLLIPSFAVGRAQALQFMLTTLMKDGRVPTMPIYLDSPMAINVSNLYYRYTELHRLNRQQCDAMCSTIKFVNHVEESKALADIHFPHIIIAGSGMATGGRILHHLKSRLADHRTTVLFTGYQAGGTRGAKMLQGVENVKIHGQWIRNRARIEVLSGLSGHGDYRDLSRWLAQSALAPRTAIQLVHGDPDALDGMCDHLRQTTKFNVTIAGYRKILTL